MLGTVGKVFFALGIVFAVALAAKAPRWEAVYEPTAQIAEKLRGAGEGVRVLVAPFEGSDARLAQKLAKQTSQALATHGVTVVALPEGGEKPKAPAWSHAVHGTLSDESATLTLTVIQRDTGVKLVTVDVDLSRRFPSTLPYWIGFALLAGVGVACWRVGAEKAAKRSLEDTAKASENPFALLAGLEAPLKKLAADMGGLSEKAVCDRVDALLEGYLLPFAAVRQKVIDRLGMRQGAEILVLVAYGERMLNRMWSAAADGHLQEARACLPEAVAALVEAQRTAERALDAGGVGGASGAPVAVGSEAEEEVSSA